MSSFHLEILAGDEVHEGDGFSGTEIPVIIVGVEQGPLADVSDIGLGLITAADVVAARAILGIGAGGSPADADVAGLLLDTDSLTRLALDPIVQTLIDQATDLPDLVEIYQNASN